MSAKRKRDWVPFTSWVRGQLSGYPSFYRVVGRFYHHLVFLMEWIRIKRSHSHVKVKYPSSGKLRALRRSGFMSQYGQEYFVLEAGYIPPKGGFFVEVGANSPNMNSNSFFLEKNCSYKGIAFDPLDYTEDWVEVRPNTKFHNVLIGAEGACIEFVRVESRNGWEDQLSGALSTFDQAGKLIDCHVERREAVSLAKMLSEIDRRVDVLFVDVEGHELEVLKSNDWKRHLPKAVVIENFNSFAEQEKIREYMKKMGYVFRMRIWISDDVYTLH